MRILLDENVPYSVVRKIKEASRRKHKVFRVPLGMKDLPLVNYTKGIRVTRFITCDKGFRNIPGIIVLRYRLNEIRKKPIVTLMAEIGMGKKRS